MATEIIIGNKKKMLISTALIFLVFNSLFGAIFFSIGNYGMFFLSFLFVLIFLYLNLMFLVKLIVFSDEIYVIYPFRFLKRRKMLLVMEIERVDFYESPGSRNAVVRFKPMSEKRKLNIDILNWSMTEVVQLVKMFNNYKVRVIVHSLQLQACLKKEKLDRVMYLGDGSMSIM